MLLDAFVCNHVEAVNNLLYVSAGGINNGQVPPNINPPYPITVGIGIMVTVPWAQTNQQHKLEIELLTEDGMPVEPPSPPDGTPKPFRLEMSFNVGRPPNVSVGDNQHVALAANLAGLPLPALGKYEFVLRIDGSDERRLAYRLSPLPPSQIVFSMPGTAPPTPA